MRYIAIVGSCIFNCYNSTYTHDKIYHRALSDYGSLNREGILCGVCDIQFTQCLLWQALFLSSIVREGQSTILAVRSYTNFIPSAVLGSVPLIYIIGVVVHHFFKRNSCSRLKTAQGTVLSSLPDRLLHLHQYRDSFGFIAASQPSHKTNLQSE